MHIFKAYLYCISLSSCCCLLLVESCVDVGSFRGCLCSILGRFYHISLLHISVAYLYCISLLPYCCLLSLESWGRCLVVWGGVLSRFLVVLEGPRGVLRGLLGVLRGLLDRSWAILGRSWAALGLSWVALGSSWGALGSSWATLVRSWGGLGPVLGGSWALWAFILFHFLLSFFTSIFHRFFFDSGKVWGGQNGQKIEVLGTFLGMLFETLFSVEYYWIFDKKQWRKTYRFSINF